MELSPRSSRSIQGSSSSSSATQTMDLDDRSTLQVQNQIPALDQPRPDSEKKRIRPDDEVGVLRESIEELEAEMMISAMQLRTCLEEKENTERNISELESWIKDLVAHHQNLETEGRLKKEQMARLSAQFQYLEPLNGSLTMELQRADQEVDALKQEVQRLELLLSDESDLHYKGRRIPGQQVLLKGCELKR